MQISPAQTPATVGVRPSVERPGGSAVDPEAERRAPLRPDADGRPGPGPQAASGSELPEQAIGAAAASADVGQQQGRRPGEPAAETAPEAASGDPLKAAEARRKGLDPEQLERLQQLEIRELAQRDREVKTHEQAHAAVGGSYAGAPHYDYARGPDGVNYAVSGHVNIDVAPVAGNPEATITKMQVVRRAALAPAEPSTQDRRVATEAASRELEARADLATQRAEAAAAEREARAERTAGAKDGGAGSADSADAGAGGQDVAVIRGQPETNPVDSRGAFLDLSV